MTTLKSSIMGIPYLNRFILEKCPQNTVHKIHLNELAGKTLVIDTSIYLYKYVGTGALLEQMYLMISIMLHYNITPIFVFDGKPPQEKHDLLVQRRIQKCEASRKCLEIQQVLSIATNHEEKQSLQLELEHLKKQCITITMNHIHLTKELFDSYGVQYICADGEADQICAYLVLSGQAWGCVSDDMDMFVLGCPRVFRHFSLLNHNVVYYDLNIILSHLTMSFDDFKTAMILSGTDYSQSLDKSISLDTTISHYMNWRSDIDNGSFYSWLLVNTDYIKNVEQFKKTWELFDVSSVGERGLIMNRPILNMTKLRNILTGVGFIFV
jgi:hypothetical protein